jgi:hypothetical protein
MSSGDANSKPLAARNAYEFLLLPSWRSDSPEARAAQRTAADEPVLRRWRFIGSFGFVLSLVQVTSSGTFSHYGALFIGIPGLAEMAGHIQLAVVRRRAKARLRELQPFSFARAKDKV